MYTETSTEAIRKKVTSKFQTTLPHLHRQKIPKTHTHTHTEEKNNCHWNPKPLQRTDTHTHTHNDKNISNIKRGKAD